MDFSLKPSDHKALHDFVGGLRYLTETTGIDFVQPRLHLTRADRRVGHIHNEPDVGWMWGIETASPCCVAGE